VAGTAGGSEKSAEAPAPSKDAPPHVALKEETSS
jgi:hypothetical protein